jgi:hypothetical protein
MVKASIDCDIREAIRGDDGDARKMLIFPAASSVLVRVVLLKALEYIIL